MMSSVRRSIQDVMNEWTRTSAEDWDSDGRSLEMSQRWKNAVQVKL